MFDAIEMACITAKRQFQPKQKDEKNHFAF